MVFIEILKQFLLNQGVSKNDIDFSKELSNIDRVKLVLFTLNDIVVDERQKKKITKFMKHVNEIFENEDLLLKFILLLKEVYECYHHITCTSSQNNSICSNRHSLGNEQDNGLLLLQENNNNECKNKDKQLCSLVTSSERFSISPSHKQINKNYSHSNFNFELNSIHKADNGGHYVNTNTNTITNNNNIQNGVYQKPLISNSTINQSTTYKKQLSSLPQFQIDLSLGLIQSHTLQNPYFNYFSFHKPTLPIISTTNNSLSKHFPLLIKTPKTIATSHSYNNIHSQLSPLTIETQIKNWLLSLHLISKKDISKPLILLSKTGALLCNIINRCETNSHSIKGVFLNPTTKPQLKLNISKSCAYIKSSMHYFINNYIKDDKDCFEHELLNGNKEMMFFIIESLYKYYNRIHPTYIRNYCNGMTKQLQYNTLTHNNNNNNTYNVYSEGNISFINNKNNKRQLQRKNVLTKHSDVKHSHQISTISNILPNKKNVSNCPSNESFMFSQVEDVGVNNYNSQNNFTVMKYWDVDDECPVMKYNNNKVNKINNTFEGIRSPNGRSKGNKMYYSCGKRNVVKRNVNGSKKNNGNDVNVNCLLLFKKSNIDKMKKEIASKTKKLGHYEEEYGEE